MACELSKIQCRYLHEHLQSSTGLCGKGNLTACQVLANLCVLTYYRGIETAGGPVSPCEVSLSIS